KVLGHAYFNELTTISGRMINFSEEDPLVSIEKNILNAISLRKKLFDAKITNAYRLINGEGDLIPGLLIDRYNDKLVIQISTLGIEQMKDMIIDILIENLGEEIDLIFEKSVMSSRNHEGLDKIEKVLWTKHKGAGVQTEILENEVKFIVDVKNGHKTGFYLDQRNMRAYITSLIRGKKLLNCFSYTGGFSVYAALNGAKEVTSVDISEEVINGAVKNFEANGIDAKQHSFVAQDVFEFLEDQKELDYDIVILDPPAFAKKKSDYGAACSGYRRLNTETLKRMKSGSILLTCSCSYHVDTESFLKQVKKAAADANKTLKLIQNHRQAEDHILNPFHPELDYLKGFVFWVE
ncbi:class I SAM-dependent rRNA methyltransferase, partial [Candidatus Dojkabacteria bacterium]|nr:class I SAM-dependent rRNA methyltransferase [Candidatus Dojkabacteria bacterium]